MTVLLQSLPRDTRFTYAASPDVFVITRPASEHDQGWVEVYDLSMTDAQARHLLDEGCSGDPRAMTFALPHHVEVLP